MNTIIIALAALLFPADLPSVEVSTGSDGQIRIVFSAPEREDEICDHIASGDGYITFWCNGDYVNCWPTWPPFCCFDSGGLTGELTGLCAAD